MDITGLVKHVESTGITVQWANFKHINAGWDHETRTIWLHHKLEHRPRMAVSVLAHEYGHAILGHEGPQDAHGEDAADRIAACLLVDEKALRRTYQAYGGNIALVAYEIGVTEHLVRVRLNSLNFGALEYRDSEFSL